jgi:DNA modification methylase
VNRHVTAHIIRGDARALPLPDASADLIITSPPYYALRNYTDNGHHYTGQIGSENTPTEYIANLIACTHEWMRVLKPTGSLFVNLGDKYAGSDGTKGGTSRSTLASSANGRPRGLRQGTWDGSGGFSRKPVTSVRPKSLIGLPWRYALACIDDLDLILRAEIIWSKPNGLPESVKDRVRRSHEQWFHLVKQPHYYTGIDEIRAEYQNPDINVGYRNGTKLARNPNRADKHNQAITVARAPQNPLGKLPGSVWTVATQPLYVPEHLNIDHYAAFPMEWPRRLILGWSPTGTCTACGEGRRPVVAKPGLTGGNGGDRNPHSRNGTRTRSTRDGGTKEWAARMTHPDTITGYACACTPHPDHPSGQANASKPPPTTPATILDPFGGTGTTALLATALGRTGISIDKSADYCRLAQWRTTDPRQLAKAAHTKPPTQPPATPHTAHQQPDLFD